LGCPFGWIEPNEKPADAAVREMWEETALLVKLTRILGVYGAPEFLVTYGNEDRVTYIMTVFECEIYEGELEAKDNGLFRLFRENVRLLVKTWQSAYALEDILIFIIISIL
jgi:8-oxo-dGTP pyrophosphatase MutT (NUDIX family)